SCANCRGPRSLRSSCKKRTLSRTLGTPVAPQQVSGLIKPNSSASVPLVFSKNPAPDAFYLGVMGEHMHVPVTPAKKCAQNPAHDADNDRAPERAPEVIHMESDHYTRHPKQPQPIEDKNEKA